MRLEQLRSPHRNKHCSSTWRGDDVEASIIYSYTHFPRSELCSPTSKRQIPSPLTFLGDLSIWNKVQMGYYAAIHHWQQYTITTSYQPEQSIKWKERFYHEQYTSQSTMNTDTYCAQSIHGWATERHLVLRTQVSMQSRKLHVIARQRAWWVRRSREERRGRSTDCTSTLSSPCIDCPEHAHGVLLISIFHAIAIDGSSLLCW